MKKKYVKASFSYLYFPKKSVVITSGFLPLDFQEDPFVAIK